MVSLNMAGLAEVHFILENINAMFTNYLGGSAREDIKVPHKRIANSCMETLVSFFFLNMQQPK